jgi:folate-binding protein YgfZ
MMLGGKGEVHVVVEDRRMAPMKGQIRYADRSSRGKLRFSGPQRAWFLHQIVTNSFEDIAPGETRSAAMLTAKGRMVGFFEAVATDDEILAHFEESLRASFPAEFERFIFATQVEVTDVTDEFGLLLLVGDGWREHAAGLPGAFLNETRTFGESAGYVWLPREEVESAIATISGDAAEISEDELEALRIGAGVPLWGRDMDSSTIPQEARLEDFGALDFDKGCYVGQETVAKIHFRGKVNKKVRSLESTGEVTVGQDVSFEGEPAGTVTSVAGKRALAILKHTIEPGAKVSVGSVDATVIS